MLALPINRAELPFLHGVVFCIEKELSLCCCSSIDRLERSKYLEVVCAWQLWTCWFRQIFSDNPIKVRLLRTRMPMNQWFVSACLAKPARHQRRKFYSQKPQILHITYVRTWYVTTSNSPQNLEAVGRYRIIVFARIYLFFPPTNIMDRSCTYLSSPIDSEHPHMQAYNIPPLNSPLIASLRSA